MRRKRAPHVLIIVQNLPVPLDRRVWLECQALKAAGYAVSVICPKGPGDPAYAELDGVHLYKYAPPRQADGLLGYAWEFLYCWLRTALLSLKVRRRARFDVLQACNPPDTYWALALPWKLAGVRFVFDHHDLNPEVFRSRFGEPKSLPGKVQLAILKWLERRTFRTANRVISTNTSYQDIAVNRGGVPREHTTVVRSGPDTSVMRPVYADDGPRRGGRHLVVYLGIMGPQDGVDGVLEVADRIVHLHGRTDFRFALLGFGDCLDDLRQQCTDLGLDDYVEFTGRVGPEQITRYLSAASVGLSPDPRSPLNDVSTMNKTMEYMAYALPVVAYRLTETVVSAADCAVYVEPGDRDGLADAVVALADDPDRRAELGSAGRRRAERVLDWRPQAQAYVGVYDELLDYASAGPFPDGWPAVDRRSGPGTGPQADRWGNPLVDLRDDQALRGFAAARMMAPGEQSKPLTGPAPQAS
ncbi:glycosyltransferase family 4 protein [Actinokineospora sp.]|uniref:glycosyltransferase family 4 protein n=1 Tax=Actinokineospora sp. TaxID=1872133 RepID=UPI00403793BC